MCVYIYTHTCIHTFIYVCLHYMWTSPALSPPVTVPELTRYRYAQNFERLVRIHSAWAESPCLEHNGIILSKVRGACVNPKTSSPACIERM